MKKLLPRKFANLFAQSKQTEHQLGDRFVNHWYSINVPQLMQDALVNIGISHTALYSMEAQSMQIFLRKVKKKRKRNWKLKMNLRGL